MKRLCTTFRSSQDQKVYSKIFHPYAGKLRKLSIFFPGIQPEAGKTIFADLVWMRKEFRFKCVKWMYPQYDLFVEKGNIHVLPCSPNFVIDNSEGIVNVYHNQKIKLSLTEDGTSWIIRAPELPAWTFLNQDEWNTWIGKNAQLKFTPDQMVSERDLLMGQDKRLLHNLIVPYLQQMEPSFKTSKKRRRKLVL